MRFELDRLDHLVVAVQAGVVARWQLLEHGAEPADIERMIRRRQLTKVPGVTGVYVNHTGALTRRQREWIAVLTAWPAALALESALPDERDGPITVAVAAGRSPKLPPAVGLVRLRGFNRSVDWRREPPAIQVEDALIAVMSRRIAADDVPGAFGVLARALHARRTFPHILLAMLARTRRIAGRATIKALIADARDGACSVLERGYLVHVERAHGLPVGSRQVASSATGRRSFKDVRYDDFGLIVELDGRAEHGSARARDNDAVRDLAELATSDSRTARITYGMVYGDQRREACRTARRIGQILRRLGWEGEVAVCPWCPSQP